ncbi:cytochrome c [Leptothrix ochracea]|uniref:c-type cytochrome n=2 Tax=Leptothrix ochracea TaxID=735331 RepID=UPI0034E261BF
MHTLITSFWQRRCSAHSAALALAILASWGGAASAQSVSSGQALYAGCAGCHGATPATGAAKIQLGTSAAVIQNATLNVGAMRGITLNATQAADLAAFIAASVAGGGVSPTTGTTTAPSAGVANGQALYAMCSGCHGAAANGYSGIGKATSASAILNAIARVGAMRGISLNTTQAADLATYISSQRGGVTSGGGYGGGYDGGGEGGGGYGGRESTHGFGNQQALMASGGCTVARSDQGADPLWLWMLVGAGWVVRTRRTVKA